MAVQQSKNRRQAGSTVRVPHRATALAVEPTTGETHLRHHHIPTGYYRRKKSPR
jgi:large subunit ribosomal protein L32